MSQTVTNVVELVVGAACLAAAVSMRGRRGAWWLAALLAIGGLTAITHAIVTQL